MSYARTCDGCGTLIKKTDEVWESMDGWFSLVRLNNNEDATARYHACSWDCLLVVAMDRNDIAPEMKTL